MRRKKTEKSTIVAELEQADHRELPEQPTPRRRDDAILVGRRARVASPSTRSCVAAASWWRPPSVDAATPPARRADARPGPPGRRCATQSGGCSGRKTSPAAFVTSSWSFATSSCQPGSVSEDAFRKPASAPAIASPFMIGNADDEGARARAGGVERPARRAPAAPGTSAGCAGSRRSRARSPARSRPAGRRGRAPRHPRRRAASRDGWLRAAPAPARWSRRTGSTSGRCASRSRSLCSSSR